MALINCPECGNTVSEKATACPHCGCPLTTEPETAILQLVREKKSLFWAARYEAYLDYQYWGILKNGDSLSAEIVLGPHHLKLIDKTNYNKVVYDADFLMDDNLTQTFSAALKLNVKSSAPSSVYTNKSKSNSIAQSMPVSAANPTRISAPVSSAGGRRCQKCGGIMTIQTVSEARKTGCGTILLYIILAITVLGWLILIPLLLRKKAETATYAVCQNCGYKARVS